MQDILPKSNDTNAINFQRFELKEEDYLAYNLHHYKTSKDYKTKMYRSWILLTFLGLGSAYLLYKTQNDQANLILIFSLITAIFYPFYYRYNIHKHFKKQSNTMYSDKINVTNDLVLRQDYCEFKSPTTYTKYLYSSFVEFVELESIYLLKVSTHQAHVIPKRCIQNEEKWRRDLIELAGQYSISVSFLGMK